MHIPAKHNGSLYVPVYPPTVYHVRIYIIQAYSRFCAGGPSHVGETHGPPGVPSNSAPGHPASTRQSHAARKLSCVHVACCRVSCVYGTERHVCCTYAACILHVCCICCMHVACRMLHVACCMYCMGGCGTDVSHVCIMLHPAAPLIVCML